MPPLGRWAADLMMLFVATIWALNTVIIKVSLSGWSSPLAFNTIRFVVSATLMALVALAVEGSLAVPWRLVPKIALLGLLGNAMNTMLFVLGLSNSTAGNAAIWLAMVPVVVALMSGLFGLDRIGLRLAVGALISFVGITAVVLANGSGLTIALGDLYFAGSVLCWSGYTVFSRGIPINIHPLRVTAIALLSACSGLLLLNMPLLLAQDFSEISLGSWLGLLYSSVFGNVVAYSLYLWCVRRIGPARTSLYNNLVPIITAAFAWLVLSETWGAFQWLGLSLVITGVMFARWDDLRGTAFRQTPP